MDNISKINVNGTTYTVGTQYESKVAVEDGEDLSLVTTGEKYEWDSKADTNGEYQNLTAGNIVGTFTDNNASFLYRPTAGAVDIESGKAGKGA